EMKVAGDMNASVQAIRKIISAGPDNYQDAMAKDLHNHFLVIDKLLAAFAFATLKLDSSFVDELKKVSTVALNNRLKKDKDADSIPLDKLGNLVWSAMKKLTEEELLIVLSKLGNLAHNKTGACPRPGPITIRIEPAPQDNPASISLTATANVIALRIVDR